MIQTLIKSFPRVKHKGANGSEGIMITPPDVSAKCTVYWGRMDNKTFITEEVLIDLVMVVKDGQFSG